MASRQTFVSQPGAIDSIIGIFHGINILKDPWRSLGEEFDRSLNHLGTIGEHLPESGWNVDISSRNKIDILDTLLGLEKEIIDSDLSEKAKKFILGKVSEIRLCISDDILCRPEEIKKAIDSVFGALMLGNPEVTKEDRGKAVYGKTLGVLIGISQIFSPGLDFIGTFEPLLSAVQIVDTYILPKVKEEVGIGTPKINPMIDSSALENGYMCFYSNLTKEQKLLGPASGSEADDTQCEHC